MSVINLQNNNLALYWTAFSVKQPQTNSSFIPYNAKQTTDKQQQKIVKEKKKTGGLETNTQIFLFMNNTGFMFCLITNIQN